MAFVKPVAQFQIGKNGINEGSIKALNALLENYKQVRIAMLPASGRDSGNIKQMAEEIRLKLARPCYTKVIGFTIILLRKGLGHDSPKNKTKKVELDRVSNL